MGISWECHARIGGLGEANVLIPLTLNLPKLGPAGTKNCKRVVGQYKRKMKR